ncbi:MAG: Gfo/Idh/MocA family oxidoreductase, partial [Oscillospiraceae bacterium]
MIKIAIIGYGNIGKSVVEAANAAKDMKIVGIIRRDIKNIPTEISTYEVKESVEQLSEKPDVAILCTPTRSVAKFAEQMIKLGINTVDSF